MIATYSEYIDRYMREPGLNGARSPGEHHFVAAYLTPRAFQIHSVVPDYISPDGTKGMLGDLVYLLDGIHSFGLEAKFETIRLTKNEFNNWIVNDDADLHPEIFIGVGTCGLALMSWADFRESYMELTGLDDPAAIDDGYGPLRAVNSLFAMEGLAGLFRYSENPDVAMARERAFLHALQEMMEHQITAQLE